MDQYKAEKYTEWILSRLEKRVKPEFRDRCPVIIEMREMVIMVKEMNFDAMDVELGMTSLSSCDQCEGGCFKQMQSH